MRSTSHTTAAASALPDWLVILLTSWTFFSIVVMNYIIAPILPTLAQQFRISISQAGLLVTVYGLLFAVAALLLGTLGDRFGQKRVISGALVVFGISTIATGLAPSFRVMLVVRGVSGLAAAAVQPANWALLAGTVPYERRGRATGWVMQAGTVALLGGVPLGGLLAETLGWRAIFFVIGSFALLIALVIQLLLPADPPRGPAASSRELLAALWGLVREQPAQVALGVSLLTWLAMFGFYTYVGAFLAERFAMSPAAIGRTTLALGLGYAVGGQIGGRLSDRLGHRPVITVGLLIIAAVCLSLPQATNVPLATALLALLGFGFFFSYSAQVTRISELLPQARSTGIAANYFTTYVGAALGAKIGGWLLLWGGFMEVGWASALAAGLAALWVVLAGHQKAER